MKRITLVLGLFTLFCSISNAQVKLDQNSGDNYFQVGYEVYTPLTIGNDGSGGVGAPWAIEYWDGGLNFWKPFPSYNNGNYKLFINDDGLVGIGKKPDTGDKLQINGNVRASANIYGSTVNVTEVNASGISDMNIVDINLCFSNGVYQFSDEKLKSNVQDISNPLDQILKLHGKSYTKKNDVLKGKVNQDKGSNNNISKRTANTGSYGKIKDETIKSDKAREQNEVVTTTDTIGTDHEAKELGLIAQEVQKIFPELVKEDHNGDLAVNYVGLIPVLIEALREQNEKIEVLEALSKGNKSSKRTSSTTNADNSSTSTNTSLVEDFSVGAVLQQNDPNPFNESTTIRYEVPEETISAFIFIYDLNGTQKKSFELNERGNGSIEVEGSEFAPGMYLYSLIVDGKEIDTKRMILTN